MIEINIAKDFTPSPGARYYTDGPFSGEEFFDKLLKGQFQAAIAQASKLKVIMDGTNGIASSFINEAFRRLGKEFGADKAWGNLIIISNEVPKYIKKAKESIYE